MSGQRTWTAVLVLDIIFHQKLLQKLKILSLDTTSIKFFKDYLINISQSVETHQLITMIIIKLINYFTVLYCIVLYCTVLYLLYCTVLYCIVLYCTVLYL